MENYGKDLPCSAFSAGINIVYLLPWVREPLAEAFIGYLTMSPSACWTVR
jgi:hypothetical protein